MMKQIVHEEDYKASNGMGFKFRFYDDGTYEVLQAAGQYARDQPIEKILEIVTGFLEDTIQNPA